MKQGDKVKIKFGGGQIGVITGVETKYDVSYPQEGKPMHGVFLKEELELTTEDPEGRPMGFRVDED
jgi:hypothetical protein